MAELTPLPEERAAAPATRRPALGYALVWAAALLFAVNGTVSKVVLASGISSLELTQVRSTGAFAGLALALLVTAPGRLRIRSLRELAFLAAFGVSGVAFVQWLYFVALHRLPVGVALLLQYLAPLIVALVAHFGLHQPVRRRIWVALALALAGLSLVVHLWTEGLSLNGLGVLAALGGAVAYALYVLLAEQGVKTRDPISLTCLGFGFAALFWLAVQPVWRFPVRRLDDRVSLLGNLSGSHAPVWLLVVFIVVVGTIVTFGLIVSALRHVSATRVGIVAMLEPVVATVVAWLWLGERLDATQLAGGGVMLAGIVLAQTAR